MCGVVWCGVVSAVDEVVCGGAVLQYAVRYIYISVLGCFHVVCMMYVIMCGSMYTFWYIFLCV